MHGAGSPPPQATAPAGRTRRRWDTVTRCRVVEGAWRARTRCHLLARMAHRDDHLPIPTPVEQLSLAYWADGRRVRAPFDGGAPRLIAPAERITGAATGRAPRPSQLRVCPAPGVLPWCDPAGGPAPRRRPRDLRRPPRLRTGELAHGLRRQRIRERDVPAVGCIWRLVGVRVHRVRSGTRADASPAVGGATRRATAGRCPASAASCGGPRSASTGSCRAMPATHAVRMRRSLHLLRDRCPAVPLAHETRIQRKGECIAP